MYPHYICLSGDGVPVLYIYISGPKCQTLCGPLWNGRIRPSIHFWGVFGRGPCYISRYLHWERESLHSPLSRQWTIKTTESNTLIPIFMTTTQREKYYSIENHTKKEIICMIEDNIAKLSHAKDMDAKLKKYAMRRKISSSHYTIN